MASIFKASVARALADQAWFMRRKDTLTAVAGTILQAANLVMAFTSGAPEWLNIVIAVVIGIAQIVIHAGTKGAITPSMAARLEQAGESANMERPHITAPTPYVGQHRAPDTTSLPVYDGPTSDA